MSHALSPEATVVQQELIEVLNSANSQQQLAEVIPLFPVFEIDTTAPIPAFGRSTPLEFYRGVAVNDQQPDYLSKLMASVEAQRAKRVAAQEAEQQALAVARATPLEVRQFIAQQAVEASKRRPKKLR